MNTSTLTPSIINSAFATNVLTSDQTNVSADETVTIGSTVYTFVAEVAESTDVLIGADADASLQNLADAINATHSLVTASDVATHAITLTATEVGYGANTIATTETSAHLSFASATMAGGVGGALSSVVINGDANGDTVYSDPMDVSHFEELTAFLNVEDHDGTTPKLDVKFQISADGTNWVDAGDAFTQVTTTDGLTFKKLTAGFGQWLRAVVATSGTNPMYQISLYLVGKGH